MFVMHVCSDAGVVPYDLDQSMRYICDSEVDLWRFGLEEGSKFKASIVFGFYLCDHDPVTRLMLVINDKNDFLATWWFICKW